MSVNRTEDSLTPSFLVVLLIALLGSCSGEKVQPPVPPIPKPPIAECVWPDAPNEAAPTWICDQPYKSYRFTAVGSYQTQDMTLAKEAAAAIARGNLASAMQTYVKKMTKTFIEQTGSKDSETTDRVANHTSVQITVAKLEDTQIVGSLTSPNRTMYVIVALDERGALNAASDAVHTSMGNARADWQKLMQGKSEEQMNREIQEWFGRDKEIVTPKTQGTR